MAKVTHEICYSNGHYTDRDGKEKTRWVKCGIIVQNDKGALSINLSAIPVGVRPGAKDGDTGVWLSAFEIRRDDRPSDEASDGPVRF